MEYNFSFKEINYGSITIESATTPSRDEVIDAIMEGNAYFKDTEYKDIRLYDPSRTKSNKERDIER